MKNNNSNATTVHTVPKHLVMLSEIKAFRIGGLFTSREMFASLAVSLWRNVNTFKFGWRIC